MSKFRCSITVSLDGYVAGLHQSLEAPLGVGGEQLHEWAVELESWRKTHGKAGGAVNASSQVMDEHLANVGAVVMGRNMFGGQPGPWREQPGQVWTGWWGEDPPFHAPVFVLTRHQRAPQPMQGGTTFHFVTEGIHAALAQARRAANGRDVLLSGGANTVQQYLREGLVDELTISLVPVLLGAGERLFDNLGPQPKLEQVRVIEAPGVTHLTYRRAR